MNENALKDLCLRYLDGELSEQEAKPFSRLIAESKDAARMLARLSIHDSRFEVTAALQPHRVESTAPSDHLMDEMLRATEQDPVHWASRPAADQTRADDATSDRMSFSHAMSLAGFALRQAAKTGPAKKLAAAAVVALIALVGWQFWGPTPSPETPAPNPLATTPNEGQAPNQLSPTERTTVATLTAEHNAKWSTHSAGGASALPVLGTQFHPNTRLTLTAGFAEITTEEGAVVILEAPAAVELLERNNAIRLHTGKLVGICETPSSKGFLVRTPHMDITDIGTRFGVDASLSEATTVHIYEGEVEVVLPPSDAGTSPTPKRLQAGQAVRASAGHSEPASIELDRSILNRALMPTKVLAMTGIGLSKGQVDPAWHVVAVDGSPITTGGEMRAHADTTPGGEGDTDPMFLKIDDALLLANERSGVFTCRSTFEVPASFDPATHQLVVWVEGDHSVKAVRINGQPMDVPANVTKLISLVFNQALTPGRQQIEIDIQEVNSIKQLRSGLRVKLELQRKPTTTEADNP